MALGPYDAGTRVRVADFTSQYRGHTGEVLSRSGSTHDVRLDGFGGSQSVPLLTPQLRDNPPASYVDYTHVE